MNISRSEGVVRVRGKGRKERVIPLSPLALEAIDAYHAQASVDAASDSSTRGAQDPAAVFRNRRGGRLTTRTIARIVAKSRTAERRRDSPSYLATFLCHASVG